MEQQNTQNLSSEIEIRKNKLKNLKEQNIIPYIEKFDRTATLQQAKTMEDGEQVSVCGRITFRRIMKSHFCKSRFLCIW